MTEMLAALLGALVGGALSAWVASRQTAKVLKHETDIAAAERREAQRLDEERRRSYAADQLVAALADFRAVARDSPDDTAAFVRVPAVAEVHRERTMRATALMKAGSSHAHALPPQLRERWDALTWMLRFNQSGQPDRSEDLRRRDASDLLNYIEYVRRSLVAVSGDCPMPPHYPAPDARREGNRPWGFEPESAQEPDLTEWHMGSRVVGKVKFSSGETSWYGPNGKVAALPDEPVDAGKPEE
ncbi:hypothetical protein [Brachybacterium hainanense]|uniref:Secreted protein n=1 Tax=Brachybacterium hainanense TaxID=1541174 RepID=A0ABV6RC66_9MICO